MTHNPILDELYTIRKQLWDDAGGDIQKYLAGVRDREAASGRLLAPCGKSASQPNSSLPGGSATQPAEPGRLAAKR